MLPPPDAFSPSYYELNMIYGRQQSALRRNAEVKKNFLEESKIWISANTDNLTAARPLTAKPVMPKELIVYDDGAEEYKTFGDLKDPELPSIKVTPGAGSGFGQPGVPIPADRQDQTIAMLRIMNDKLDKILAGHK